MARRIHITGASGSGTTSLGRALSQSLDLSHFDTDDFYWMPTEQPYTTKRDPTERLALMQKLFVPAQEWILTGSVMGWGDTLIPQLDLIVFLRATTQTRIERLRERENRRFGAEAVSPGGPRHVMHVEFLEWAAQYEQQGFKGRSARRHEVWLELATCPVLRLDGTQPMDTLVTSVKKALTTSATAV